MQRRKSQEPTAADSATDNTARRCRRVLPLGRRGGTLLEVLISLVILSMALRLVVQIADRSRGAARLARDAELGTVSAMHWRAGRSRLEPWTDGERGEFPSAPLTWRLIAVAQPADTQPLADERWRLLELQRVEEVRPFWSMIVRLNSAQNEAPLQ